MKLSCPALSFCITLFSFGAFAQTNDSVSVMAYASKSKGYDSRMNRMKVEPQLTHKLYNTGKGHNAYKLKDGMVCLAPDSVVLQRIRIVKTME